jgi:hypothetical protein
VPQGLHPIINIIVKNGIGKPTLDFATQISTQSVPGRGFSTSRRTNVQGKFLQLNGRGKFCLPLKLNALYRERHPLRL